MEKYSHSAVRFFFSHCKYSEATPSFSGRSSLSLFRIIPLFLFLLLLSHQSFSIGDDSTYHRYNPLWTHYFFAKDFSKRIGIDTTLNRFEIYDAGKSGLGLYNLGNLGLPYYSSVFSLRNTLSLDIGFHSFDNYLFNPEDVRFFDTKKPYSHLFYVFSFQNEQQITGTHTQNVSKLVNLGFEFRRSGSEGIYQRQRADVFNIDIFGSYHSKNERYHLNAYTIFNKLKWNDNGGVTNDSVFTDELLLNKNLASVALDSSQTSFRGKSIGFTHSYDWGSFYTKRINDTVTLRKFSPSFRLEHRFNFDDYKYSFHDDTTDFDFYFNYFNYSRNKTDDTLTWKKIENRLSFQLLPEKKRTDDTTAQYRKIFASFSLNHQLLFIRNRMNETTMQQLTGRFDLQNVNRKRWLYGLSLESKLNQLSEPEYSAAITGGYNLSKELGSIGIRLSNARIIPSVLLQQYYSNHYSWKNDFSSYTLQNAGISWVTGQSGFILNAEVLQISNYTYWNSMAVPEQTSEEITGFIFTLQKNFSLGHFHLDNELAVQQFSDEKIISVPEYVGMHSLYFQNDLFKKAMGLRIGVDVYYTSGYYIPAFSPATSQFYLQDEMKATFYPVTDVFVNIKVRSARLFAKMENLSQEWWQPGYYTALNYPAPDKVVKLGISWMFWN